MDIVKEKERDLKSKLPLGKLGMPAQETFATYEVQGL